MKLIGLSQNKQQFLDNIETHIKSNYVHFRHIEGAFTENMRIVFEICKGGEWGAVTVRGYNFYVEMGNAVYCLYLDETIRSELAHLPIFKQNQELYQAKELNEKLPIIDFVNKDERLRKLNSHRTRNFILYKNNSMELVYDSHNEKLMFVSNKHTPFSSIEHDTNRKFTEEICVDILLDFKDKKEKFIKMLSRPQYEKNYIPAYKKYVNILKGEATDFTDEDIIIMISILGRLNQEENMGQITVQRDNKLNPNEISKHKTLQKYIVACVSTIKEYSNVYLLNRNELKQLGNIGFDGKLNRSDLIPSPIPLLAYNNQSVTQIEISEPKIVGNIYAPNYIESFFKKITDLPEYSSLPIFIDDYKDILVELMDYAGRYKGNSNPDFIVLAKIKSILLYKRFGSLIKLVEKKIYEISSKQTYYRMIAEHLLALKDEDKQKKEFYKLLSIYENHITDEIKRYFSSRNDNVNSEFNDDEISISSDMHFNDMKDIAQENFSKNFNIIAGDFYNNSYHRAGAKITDRSDIIGIGVLGNHDVSWIDSIDDIKEEISTDYRKSISTLKAVFPNVKILNNEVFYKNGIAFVGLTMVTDEIVPGKRSFFKNEQLGTLFFNEKYISQAKKLLDSVDSNTPIVVISHSPFKEYAVCKNKEIGIFSERIFANYPNVKAYIHGHGHSRQNSWYIDKVLCISNPIVNNIYRDSRFPSNWKTLSGKENNDGPLAIKNKST